MNLVTIQLHVEALLFASERPLTLWDITDMIVNVFETENCSMDNIQSSVLLIQEKYKQDVYPFELKEAGGGYQFLTKKDFHQTILQLNGDKYVKKLSTAAMETLSIIAYKQPVTKNDIEFIRGVSADYSIQRLLEKELIIIAGRKEDAIGKPLLYATSRSFMDYLGINDMAELPKLKEFNAEQVIVPTDALEAQVE